VNIRPAADPVQAFCKRKKWLRLPAGLGHRPRAQQSADEHSKDRATICQPPVRRRTACDARRIRRKRRAPANCRIFFSFERGQPERRAVNTKRIIERTVALRFL